MELAVIATKLILAVYLAVDMAFRKEPTWLTVVGTLVLGVLIGAELTKMCW